MCLHLLELKALAILFLKLANKMPSNSLHSPLSSGEELFADGSEANLNDVYSEQNDHKKSKHRKHGKHKNKKHKKHKSSSQLNLDDETAQQASNKHRKHKSKHQFENELYDFEPKPQQINNKPLGYDDLSDDDGLMVCISFFSFNFKFCFI